MAMIPKSATRDIMIRFSEPAAGGLKSAKASFWGRFCRFFHVSHSRNEPLGIGLPQVNSHARMRRRPSI